MLLRFLLLTKDDKFKDFLTNHFNLPDIRFEDFKSKKNSFYKITRASGDLIIIDSEMLPEPKDSSLSLLNMLPDSPTVIIMHNSDSSKEHANYLTLGADVVLYSGLPYKTLVNAIESTIESRKQLALNPWQTKIISNSTRTSNFVSNSPQMSVLMEMVDKITSGNTPVLLTGETGVGKDHLAKLIHSQSQNSQGAFIAINCAALPEQLLESELFGHEIGAFSGAVRARRGAFEMAHGGTLYLDEIGELALNLQAKLLRVLQDFEIKPLGSEKTINVDIRLITATNRNLEEEVEKGNFRRDLYYRLGVFPLLIPPLRERKEDIEEIVYSYIYQTSSRLNKNVNDIDSEALEMLINYSWPGNIRELINAIERSIILCSGTTIKAKDLPQGLNGNITFESSTEDFLGKLVPGWQNMKMAELKNKALKIVESEYIKEKLRECKGKVGKVAEVAGVHPRGLFDKMKKYDIKKEDYK